MVRPLGLMILFGGLLATLAFFLGALGLRLRRARLTITTVKRSHVQSFGNAVAALVPLHPSVSKLSLARIGCVSVV